MTGKPVAEGQPTTLEPPEVVYDYDPTTVTLQKVQQQGATALINLEGAIQEAERSLKRMKFYIEKGTMGAEAVPALEAAIAEAKQVQTEMIALIQEASVGTSTDQ